MPVLWRTAEPMDKEGYRLLFQDNAGPDDGITTVGILEGYRALKEELLTDSFFEEVKKSPMYVRGAPAV